MRCDNATEGHGCHEMDLRMRELYIYISADALHS